MADSDTTARGLLMLRPIPTLFTEDTSDIDWEDTTDMDLDTVTDSDTTARGLLMLRLSLILTTPPMVLDTPDTSDMPDSDTDTLDMPDSHTSTVNRFHQDLSVNHRLDLQQKWIVISLKFPSSVLQFQCYHTKCLVMVSRKQENQSGKNPTNIKISKKSIVLFLVNIGRQTIQRCSINTLK